MSEPISRQTLDEALNSVDKPLDDLVSMRTIEAAAQAILDGERVKWCVTHDNGMANADAEVCWAFHHEPEHPCQFATYVRVKVGP